MSWPCVLDRGAADKGIAPCQVVSMSDNQSVARPRVAGRDGLLEPFLARLRARKGQALIPPHSHTGRLLDIGCGAYPFFLISIPFAEKYGVDRLERSVVAETGINFQQIDLESGGHFPFADEYFDVVTMLAVYEHISRERLPLLLDETYRVLKPGGTLIITTPAWWTSGLLAGLARLGLVNRRQIEEHKGSYRCEEITASLQQAGFPASSMRSGSFELGMNTWVRAVRL
jgi:SAM-dependent methyltransferase